MVKKTHRQKKAPHAIEAVLLLVAIGVWGSVVAKSVGLVYTSASCSDAQPCSGKR